MPAPLIPQFPEPTLQLSDYMKENHTHYRVADETNSEANTSALRVWCVTDDAICSADLEVGMPG